MGYYRQFLNRNITFFNFVSFSNGSVPQTEELNRKELSDERHRYSYRRDIKIIYLIHSLFLLLCLLVA